MVITDFNVDADGRICWVRIINGTDEAYNNAIQTAVYRMRQWKPAVKKGKTVLMTMRLAVSFSVTNPRLIRFWSCVKSPDQTNFREDNRYASWSPDNGIGYSGDSYPETLLNYYAFTTSGLGWINCDRFYNSSSPQTQLFVSEPITDHTSMKLIFHTIKSVLNARVTDGKYCFGNVPKGMAVTIVALRGEKQHLEMAVKTLRISDAVVSGFTFKKVSPDDIQSTMHQFDNLPGAVIKN